jgi:Holliday junction DNA helicase RuvA
MINHLTGTIHECGKDHVVIECGGIGFRLSATPAALRGLVVGQGPVTILAHLQVRESGSELFGFASLEEREIFHALTSVAGVGPKSGMAVLSVLGAAGILSGVLRQDAKLLASVPGIGKKLAQRMVSELPERLKKLAEGDAATVHMAHPSEAGGSAMSEAVEALVSLGFSRPEAHDAVGQVERADPGGADIERLIKGGLARLRTNARSAGG